MTVHVPKGDTAEATLAAAVDLYEQAVIDLQDVIEKLKMQTPVGESETKKSIGQLRLAVSLVLQERNRLEERRRKETGAKGAEALDFGAARDEVRRRLACLRTAGNTGTVSKESE